MLIQPVNDGLIQVVFDDDSIAYRSDVVVYDANGEILKEGRADLDGYFDYSDVLNPVTIVASDDWGHRAQWEVGADEPKILPRAPMAIGVLVIFGAIGGYFQLRMKKKNTISKVCID